MTQFNGLPFDPSDPALFNFDIASLNFGNQYGALEFGMLNHMSAGANGEQGPELMNQLGQIQGFNQGYTDPALTFSQDAFVNANWDNNEPRASSTSGLLQTPHNTPMMTSVDRHDSISHFPKGYAIGAGPSSMSTASPAASAGIPDAPLDNPQSPALFLSAAQPPSSPAIARHQSVTSLKQQTQQPVQPVQPPTSTDMYNQAYEAPAPPANPLKRAYDADIIYETVNKPYPYTTGFHRLFHYISHNFSSEKRLRVAKAVAAIRPSLITFSQGLTEKDLIFMERSVQRKLYEFHDFLQLTGTPTIMARRDGAIVSASKEFSILTGWSKQILLGREPNLNVNSGNASAASTAPNSAARTRLSSVERESAERNPAGLQSNTAMPTPPPVLLAEILDQDTVVQFYEDYAKLAFSSAGGSVLRRGRLLKYRTKSDASILNNSGNNDERALKKRKRSQSIKQEHAESGTATYVKGEHGITQLGEVEGSVDVMYCWACRRDVFEVPTLIVMNVSVR
jgi:PAS domain-containing protein